MPSQRRLRVFLLVVFAGVITLLLFTSHLRQTRPQDTRTIQDFYHKTLNGMDKSKQGSQTILDTKPEPAKPIDHDNDGDIDTDDEVLAKEMGDRLKAAEQKAKDNANAKAPNPPDKPSEIVGVGSSAEGQKKKGAHDEVVEETEEDHEIEQELNGILKKSPVIIFSKSYCPYSKKAKAILLEKYSIDPAPFVVELDLHPLGPKLQEKLLETTGRKTVPNIMINGKSIGGGDDIAAFHAQKMLADKIKSLGGKRIAITELEAPAA